MARRRRQASTRGQVLSTSAKHSASGVPDSNSRKTSPIAICAIGRANMIPPARPRWVCRYFNCAKRLITCARWLSDVLQRAAISALVTRRSAFAPQNISTRTAMFVRLVMRMGSVRLLDLSVILRTNPTTKHDTDQRDAEKIHEPCIFLRLWQPGEPRHPHVSGRASGASARLAACLAAHGAAPGGLSDGGAGCDGRDRRADRRGPPRRLGGTR